MRRTATEFQKRRIETDKIAIRLGARSRHERDSRFRSALLLDNVPLEREIFRVPIESAAADGDDLSLSVRHLSYVSRSPRLKVCSCPLFPLAGGFSELPSGLFRYFLIPGTNAIEFFFFKLFQIQKGILCAFHYMNQFI
jgi:hypothetical protein